MFSEKIVPVNISPRLMVLLNKKQPAGSVLWKACRVFGAWVMWQHHINAKSYKMTFKSHVGVTFRYTGCGLVGLKLTAVYCENVFIKNILCGSAGLQIWSCGFPTITPLGVCFVVVLFSLLSGTLSLNLPSF